MLLYFENMESGAMPRIFYLPEALPLSEPGIMFLLRPSRAFSVVSVEPVTPSEESSVALLLFGTVGSVVGWVACVVGAVGASVGRMVGMDSVMPVGVEASSLFVLVQPQPVNSAAVRIRVIARIQIFFIL